jgi:hypothetical protein
MDQSLALLRKTCSRTPIYCLTAGLRNVDQMPIPKYPFVEREKTRNDLVLQHQVLRRQGVSP